MQKMMTKELASKMPPLYAQDGMGDKAVAFGHWFSCWNGWDWYATEYDPDTQECFGLVRGFATELGYFSLYEFEELNKQRGFELVERDIYWSPKTIGEIRKSL
jgi:hypothetical protein